MTPLDLSFGHIATRNGSHLWDIKYLPDFRASYEMLFVRGFHQACHGPLNIINNIVDHLVESDIYILLDRQVTHLGIRPDTKTDDDSFRDRG